MDILEIVKENIVYIVFIVPKIIKSNIIQLLIIGSLFAFGLLHKYYFSKSAQNKHFKETFRQYLQKNPTVVFRYIIPENGNFQTIRYSGEQGRWDIGQFFEHLLKTEYEIFKKYGNDVKIWQTVVNEQPSFIFQINKDDDNYMKVYKDIYENHRTFLTEEKKAKGFKSLLNRRHYFDINPSIKHLSIYWKDGEAQQSFQHNIENSNGRIKGYKVKDASIVRPSLRGQFTIIKKDTGAILLFIEYNGQQFYSGKNTQDKQLQFFHCENKHDIAKFDKDLYDLMYLVGLLDEI
jgi:hypothetical protein